MIKIAHVITVMCFCIALTACSNFSSKNSFNNGSTQWDFDHRIQFRQTNLTTNHYQLEIIPNNKVNFERLTALLIRKSYLLCGSYHYKIEMIQGIEGFDDKRAMPNYIFPSLMANVECKPKRNKDKY